MFDIISGNVILFILLFSQMKVNLFLNKKLLYTLCLLKHEITRSKKVFVVFEFFYCSETRFILLDQYLNWF